MDAQKRAGAKGGEAMTESRPHRIRSRFAAAKTVSSDLFFFNLYRLRTSGFLGSIQVTMGQSRHEQSAGHLWLSWLPALELNTTTNSDALLQVSHRVLTNIKETSGLHPRAHL